MPSNEKAYELSLNIAKQESRITTLQNDLADGLISTEDFKQMRICYSDALSKSRAELANLHSDTGKKSDLLKQALKVINSISEFYVGAEGKAKIKLLGSIFPEMIEFDGEKCRTTTINSAIALYLSADKGFSKKKPDTP